MTDISIHHCRSIRVRSHTTSNANHISLEITTEDGPVELTLYHLPVATTDTLKLNFSDAETADFDASRAPAADVGLVSTDDPS